ncbi:DUF3240 domain-containing protein [Thiorhodococcus mannitoliphagus]|uniref:DUF3240 domain-containing protein n=1 Tax=Thiorhodococcus mannitoliphagus TaxID=329406 RepID=A0A6P1E216_9GAMM|nr:DUF3240 family protein [Thiorhodococcus mannitoliphagus]NEX22552.1 DUF3240 domain-containing protein [Thiorhodococcus mannitoliphagus]
MPNQLIYLIVPPAAEDVVAEWLLERDDVPGFTSTPVSGHGSSERSMTLAEQVAGRSRRVMFFIHLPTPVAASVLAALREEFSGSGIHYWLVPVLEFGRLE